MSRISHVAAFERNLGDVTRLLEVHSLVAGRVAGRASALQVLNRSAVVLLAACWEAFVEDLAIAAFDLLLTNCPEPSVFPRKVRAKATRAIRENKNELAIWALAGNGWRDVLTHHRDETIQAAIETFNSPKALHIDYLYNNLIGLPKLSSHWRWPGMSPESVRKKLDRLLIIRGDIAHRARHSSSVKRPELDDFIAFAYRLSIRSHNAVATHLAEVTSKNLWPQIEHVAINIGSPDERRKRIKRSWKKRN
jgi:hypothetical protein